MKEILILGEFSSGKTAFINMLLGYPVLPEKMISTDLPVVKIASGVKSNISYTDISNNTTNINSWEETPSDWNKLKTLNVFIKGHPLLETGVTIYDTPGINTTNTHHIEHIEKFLNSNPKNYKLVLFFIPDKISKTAIDFLNQWKSKFKNLMIVINIKDAKSDSECKQVERSIKKTVLSELGSIPIHLISIGDLYEKFYERYENANNWETVADWSNKQANFNKSIEYNIESLVGEDIFEIIWAIAESKEETTKNYDKLTESELLELSKYDDSNAMFERASRLFNKEMFDEVIPLLRDAIKYGNSDAENMLGVCYRLGLGVNENINTAAEYFQKSANANNDKGLLNLGLYYLECSIADSWDQAFDLIKKSVELGNQLAEYELGRLYLDDRKYDENKAFELISNAAKNDIPEAFSQLAMHYEQGIGTKQNYTEAIAFYNLGIKYNDPYAYYSLYLLHEDEEVKYKISDPFAYIQKAAEAEIPEAQFYYADELEKRNNYTEALKWYKKSYDNEYLYAGISVANYYLEGRGVKLDKERGFLILHELSKDGFVHAKTQLAFCYANGEGVARDEKHAFKLLLEAAEADDYDAQLNLINCYGNGVLTKIDYWEAFFWEKRASYLINEPNPRFNYKNKIDNSSIKSVLLKLQNIFKGRLLSAQSLGIVKYVEEKVNELSKIEREINQLTDSSPVKHASDIFTRIKNYDFQIENLLETSNQSEINYLKLSKEVIEIDIKPLKKEWENKIHDILINVKMNKLIIDKGLRKKLKETITEIEKEFASEIHKITTESMGDIFGAENLVFKWKEKVRETNTYKTFADKVLLIIRDEIQKDLPTYPLFSDTHDRSTSDIASKILIRIEEIKENSMKNWEDKKYDPQEIFSLAVIILSILSIMAIDLVISALNFPIWFIGLLSLYIGFLAYVMAESNKKKEKEKSYDSFKNDSKRYKLLPYNTIDVLTNLSNTQKFVFGQYDINGHLSNEEDLFHLIVEKAEQGDADAQYELGVIYERGDGAKKDKEEAIKWYTKAAEQGEIHAKFRLTIIDKNSKNGNTK